MEKETKVKTIDKVNKKPLIISLISTAVAILIICTTLLLIFSNRSNAFQLNKMFSKNLLAVKFDDGWGYVDSEGSVKIKGQFGEANPFADNGLALVSIDGYYGYINTSGKYIVNPIYSQAKSFNNDSDFAVVKRNSKCGYINSKGEEIISCQFEEAHAFSHGLALVRIGGKYGFINTKGKFEINPIYDYAESFVNNKLTIVGKQMNTKMSYACLSKSGELLTDFMLNEVSVSDKYVILYEGTYYSFCGLDLVPLFKTNYQINNFPIELNAFENVSDNLIPFKDVETYKYGYLNKQGQVVIESKYDLIGNFYNGMAMVKIDNKYGYINTKGQLIVNNEYDFANNYNENYATVGNIIDGNTCWGLIDNKGNICIDIEYYTLGNVYQGLCYFTTMDNELLGYINVENEVVIPQVYTSINKAGSGYNFTDDGYVVIRQDEKYGILNTNNEFVVNPYLLDVKY